MAVLHGMGAKTNTRVLGWHYVRIIMIVPMACPHSEGGRNTLRFGELPDLLESGTFRVFAAKDSSKLGNYTALISYLAYDQNAYRRGD